MKKTDTGYISKISFLLVLVLILSVCFSVRVAAEEQPNKEKAIVFVLDASGSMKSNDPERLAIDSIAQLIYSLPSDYQVGFVAYNSELVAHWNLVGNSQRSQIMYEAEDAAYAGFSNAGIGLECAVGMLTDAKADEMHIVMLSDGEILMEDEEATSKSRQLYQNAIQQAAEEKIKVHVIGLEDEMEDMDNFIFSAAEATEGKTYYTPQALEIQGAIDSILTDELNIKQSAIAIVDADGEVETVSAELPYTYASKVRILLTSTAPVINLSTNFQADNAKQTNGNRYSLIEISKPSGEKLELSFEGTQGSQVRINIIPEYRVAVKGVIDYTDEVPEEEGAFYYNRSAEVTYSFYDADNQDIQLWTQDFFEYTKISIIENDEKKEMSLSGGTLKTNHSLQEQMTLEVEADYSEMPVNVISFHSLIIDMDAAPLLPAEEPEPPYALIVAGAAGVVMIAIIIGIIIWQRQKPRPLPMPPEDRPEPSKYSYTGKMNIYVTRTQSGYDIPPLSFNLFRLPSGRVVSMKEVLESCDVKEEFTGADSIYFKSGANRNLIITNNSDCTIMKNREILMKKKSYQLPLESKVDITFEDEISELTFQYKDLKPSVMQSIR